MSSKDEVKELESIINSFDSELSIWLLLKLIDRFENELQDLLRPINTHENLLSLKFDHLYSSKQASILVKQCESLKNVKSKSLLILLDLEIDIKIKKSFLKEIKHDNPDFEIVRILKIIEKDKRLAHFINYLSIKENNLFVRSLLGSNRIQSKDQIKNIFDQNELVCFYSNNTPLLVNLNFTIQYLNKENYEQFFKDCFNKMKYIQKKSNTVIDKNIKNKEFSDWLFNYIEKNIIDDEMTSNTTYTPYTSEEKVNFMLHQLDLWCILDEDRYDQVLKRIQAAWHKKTHDERKRKTKLQR